MCHPLKSLMMIMTNLRILLALCALLAITWPQHADAQAPAARFAAAMRAKPGYAFITSDIELCRIAKYDAEGNPFWIYDKQVKPIDVWAMPGGPVLIAYLPSPLTKNMGGVRMVDANKDTVFDLPVDDEIMSVQPLENGNFLMAECHSGRITEMDRKGNRINSFNVVTKPSGHQTVRQIRLTPGGTILAAECYSHKLREYARGGKLLREIDLRFVYYPVPLPNGNILAACWNHPEAQVVELDPKGVALWNLKAADLPGEMGVMHIAGVARLPNGNTLISTSCKAGKAPNPRAMLFEITPDKQIVWQMQDKDGSSWISTVKLMEAEPPRQPQAAAEPSISWSFDGTAAGLTPVGGAVRFASDADVPATDGKALVLENAANNAGCLTAPMTEATRLGASYTIEAWIHPTALSEWNRIVLNWGASSQYAYHLALHQGMASLQHCQSNGRYIACEGGAVQTGRWQHLAGVADATAKTLKVYLNGKPVATMPFDGTAATTSSEGFAIGDSATLGDPRARFTGYLDSVTLWKHPLSDAQVAVRYAAHAKSPPVGKSIPGEIVFAERHPGRDPSNHFYANFGYTCTNENEWLHGADGGRLAIYNPSTGETRTLLEDPKGAVRDPQVHYDAKKVLFSYRKGGTHHYNLHEINLDGSGLKQLTTGDWDDIEPIYLPDGGIAFCSTRCKRYILCWMAPAATLHRCDADGANIRQLSSGAATETTPAVLPDGRILFTRWEYVNRASTQFKQLWTMNPDGSGVMTYFGNMHPSGYEFIDARPVPGTGKIVYINGGHCTNEHAGGMMLLDPRNGPDDLSTTRPILGGNIRDPFPVSTRDFLAARGNEILLVDDIGKTQTIHRANMMVHEPRLITPSPREAVIPSQLNPAKTTGTLILTDVNIGRNMAGLKPGTIKKLLVMEQLPKPVNYHGGGTTPIAHGGKWTINRILGTVPVDPDGSANFEVPANRSIYLAALDENDLSVKQMRSFLTVMPGERVSCIGCHENRTMTPPAGRTPLAAGRAPDQIQAIPGTPEILDFPRDVQPVLDRHCISCHNPAKRDGGVVLTGDHGPTYSLSYYNLMLHRQIKDTAGAGWTNTRNSGGEPVGNDAPYEAFSSASPLMKLIDGSHNQVRLSSTERAIIRLWLDSATPYAGTYAAYGTGQIGGWWRNNEPIREMSENWPSTAPARDAMTRRCATCHENRMPTHVTDQHVATIGGYYDFEGFQRPVSRFSRHHIFNLTHPEKSLALMATVAKSAGGEADGALPPPKPVPADWAFAPKPFTHPIVFTTTADPDYQKILAHLMAAKTRLDEIKRFDMPGFQPRHEYLREMKRYGVLPPEFNLAKPAAVDPYALDKRYWQLFWNKQPITPTNSES